MRLKLSLVAVVTALIAGISGAAQKPAQEPEKKTQTSFSEPRVTITPRVKPGGEPTPEQRRANIRVDTTMVLIPTTVTDPLNRFVTGLR